MPRVSVIIPLYNKAPYIERALFSVSRQTFVDFEIIVVDDGSTDGGERIASSYPHRSLSVLSQRNAGPGAARNRGIGQSQGELIAFLDADDEWMPEYLETSIRFLDNLGGDVVAVTSGYVEFPRGISRESMWHKRGIIEGVQQVSQSTKPSHLAYMLAFMTPCSTVAYTHIVRKYSGFYDSNNCRFGEDGFLWLKILLNHAVYFYRRPLICIHREASELSGNYIGSRPVEPFLAHPDEIVGICPLELRSLLNRFYAVRACKTATMLGYWGEWRKAHALFSKFVRLQDWLEPFFVPALVSCTPVAGLIGRIIEMIR